MPEPLLAPLEDQAWQVLWSSEAPSYGGGGTPPLYRDGNLHIPGESALVLCPGPLTAEAAPELHGLGGRAGAGTMVDVIRVTRDENPVDGRAPRMARDERARRLRLGDGVRRDHPALSRLPDRRLAGAARPGRDAERSRMRDRARRRQRRQRCARPAGSPASRCRWGCRAGATRSTA